MVMVGRNYSANGCAHHFHEDFGLATRIARYHNVYGPRGTYDGGREKAPAAICRKVIAAKLSGSDEIEICGDGKQTRSFMWIDDCVKGTQMILDGDYVDPLNLGSSELGMVNQLVDIVEKIGGVKLKRRHNLTAPKGVNGRNSDNSLIRKLFRLGDFPWVCAMGWSKRIAGSLTKRHRHHGLDRRDSRRRRASFLSSFCGRVTQNG